MFLAFGEVMARIAPEAHLRWAQSLPGRVQVTWGGGEANVAASLAMFGKPTRYLTSLPETPIARSLEGKTHRNNLRIELLANARVGVIQQGGHLWFVNICPGHEENRSRVIVSDDLHELLGSVPK